MDDLARFCCQNETCADYGKRGARNLTVCMRYGKDKRLRLLYCRTCHARFSERKGTPLFQARLPEAKVEAVLAHIAEGCGVRKTGRLVGVNRETVARYSGLAGEHARALHEELVAFSPANTRGAVRRKMGLRGQERKAL
jgi:LacI family transcriptional regulator